MEPASVRTKVPSFLSDLGKATLRGIRKCPRCGTYNGTRGLSCKNKNCGTVFRYGTRKQPGVDAVKIITGSDLQVYSVRQRDRGPDYRCFVELGVSETAIQTVDGTIITQLSSGRCYVPSCLKAATQGVVENQCQHVKLALNCQTEATPLTLKSSVLNSMQASPETKQTIWQLATEPTGPLVQRITKNVLVVKCKASQKHSLGYLHASFAQKMSAKTLTDHRFSCSCQTPKPGKGGPAEEEAPPAPPRCIHFFACICAFASDESLAQEFADFLTYDAGGRWGGDVQRIWADGGRGGRRAVKGPCQADASCSCPFSCFALPGLPLHLLPIGASLAGALFPAPLPLQVESFVECDFSGAAALPLAPRVGLELGLLFLLGWSGAGGSPARCERPSGGSSRWDLVPPGGGRGGGGGGGCVHPSRCAQIILPCL